MGEQSTKTLRGGKMEDIIFGGTQRRNQMNYAEVSLIFDNSEGRLNVDTTEVMLTRRYYRSGDSEYYINQQLVRLKDMNDLLMDTGLGREGYCIIGQGRIAEILSSKSKDRREIFEEATGISRYRHRKDESERKLQQTEDNLLRIGDKIQENEKMLPDLREQAEVAKRFLLLRDELRILEISLWLRELETISARAEKAEIDHLTATRNFDAAKQEYDKQYEESESLSEVTRDSNKEADSIRALMSTSKEKQEEIERSIAVMKSQLEGNTVQIENISGELQNQSEQHDGIGLQISDQEERLDEIENEISLNQKQVDTLSAELQDIIGNTGKSTQEQSELIKKETDLQQQHSDMKSGHSALLSQAQEIYDKENSVEQELSTAKTDLKEKEATFEKNSKELKKSQEEVDSLENVIKGLTIKTDNRTKKVNTVTETVNSLEFDLKTMQSRKDMLTEMEKEYDGYSKSVQRVMQEHSRGALKNIHGTVGGLVKTEDIYSIAIETALGHAMQNIVVSTDDDGEAAINFLKNRNAGRATFLPISTVKGNVLSEDEFKGDSGFEGLAFDLISYDPKYKGIYASLLGRVVIADDLGSAKKIARRHNHRYKIVSLDGQVINAGGSMTGGSRNDKVGVLSRANELEKLAERIKTCAFELTQKQRELAECVREKTAAEYELSTAGAELRAAQDIVLKQKLDESHSKQLIQAIKENIKSFETEISSIASRIKQNLKDTKQIKSELIKNEKETASIKEKVEKAIEGHELLIAERDRVNTQLAELRTESARLDSEKLAKTDGITDLYKIRDEMFGSRERQLEMISGLKTKNEQICAEILIKEREASTAKDEIDNLEKSLTKLNDRKFEVEEKRNKLSKALHDKNNEINTLQNKCLQLELKKQSVSYEEKTISDKLWDTYNLSKTAAVAIGVPVENIKSTQSRINSIKREQTELGEVNIGAIKEFEKVNERYEFLTSQRDDVESAKFELLKIIDDITAHMKAIFIKEFEIINKNFEHTFKELFGGGKASLMLENPDDVLNCGIDIQAQPPGKQIKIIASLSGGEQALVAIAIYFAILAVRPPPFVVMDEIDASLDEANAFRFADYMRLMSDKTQMIVISHKRRTMEEADVLYGVTMQEHGVSSLLCIDLDEAEKQMKSKVNS